MELSITTVTSTPSTGEGQPSRSSLTPSRTREAYGVDLASAGSTGHQAAEY